jgi:hypothetical protein
MALQPPPSRYRVVERGRRLEVIDTQTGAASGGREVAPLTSARPGVFGRTVARAASLGATDAAGRALYTTATWFDDRGPRTLLLDEVGTRKLARAAATVALVTVVAVAVLGVFAWAVPVVGWAVMSQHGRVPMARWLDGFTPAPR